jgi:ribonuclease Y
MAPTLFMDVTAPPLVLADVSETVLIVAVVIAVMLGFGVVKFLDYLRKRDADKEAAQIIERAEIEAATRRKEAAVEAREMALQEKAKLEKENEEIRRQLHDRERKLDKAEDANQSRAEQLQKQEKMVESNQRRLAEKVEDAKRNSTTCPTLNGRRCTNSAD